MLIPYKKTKGSFPFLHMVNVTLCSQPEFYRMTLNFLRFLKATLIYTYAG